MITEPDTLTIDNHPYPLLKLAAGRVRWEVVPVETQPGDGGIAKPHTLYWHGGFGVSRRYSAGPQGGQGHHDYCFPAGTHIRSLSDVQMVFRRWYEGPLVKLTTARGHILTGTPNHPVLTEQGWVLLGSLHEGDGVFSSGIRRHGNAPHNEDGYVAIDEVFRLATPPVTRPRGGLMPVDLDCNGFSKEVDVVRVDGFLRHRLKTMFAEQRTELDLAPSVRHTRRALLALGDEQTGAVREWSSQSGSHVRSPDLALLAREAVPVGPRALACDLPADGWGDGPGTACLAISTSDTEILETNTDSSFGYSEITCEVLRAFPGEVAPDEIVLIERNFARCHVYSLQTAAGTYYAENVIVHNSENMWLGTDGVIQVAPRITFLDVSGKSSKGGAFILGGFKRSRLGGATTAGLGGGEYVDVPQWMERFGDALYVNAGTNTYKIDPTVATPTLDETHNHGTGARARSADVFGNQLVVALGDGVDAEVATSPGGTTVWSTATGVQRSVYRVGSSGRLFNTKGNRAFAVNEGFDPTDINNYVPTAGEPISDATDPIVGLAEWQRGLIAGHARGARTLDPDSGYIDRPLVPRSRLSPSDYDGRAILTAGPLLLFAQTRAVSLFAPGRLPVNAGLELLEQNESPYVGPEYGIPDWAGVGFWPVFFAETGDSVIFHVRERKEGEPGIGPLRWMPFLFLENVECRVVGYWGGTATRKPRLFFGGSTTTNPEIVGWVDLGEQGGDADIFSSDAVPALTGTVFGPDDDFNLPNTIQEVERLEMPEVLGADGDNFGVWSVSDDGGATYKDLLVDPDTSAGGARIDSNGPQTVFASVFDPPSGRKLKFRFTITQAAAATAFFQARGYPTAYISERPLLADQVTTVLDIREVRDVEDAEARVKRLKTLVGKKVQIQGDAGHDEPWVRIVSVKTVTVEVSDASGRGSTEREATGVVFREVAVGG